MRRGTGGRERAHGSGARSGCATAERARRGVRVRVATGDFPGRCRLGARAAGWVEVAADLGMRRETAGGRDEGARPVNSAETEEEMMGRLKWVGRAALALWWLAPAALAAQGTSPWVEAVNELQAQFTGPIARGLSLIAIVIGGLMFAFGEGGSKRTLAGIVFGLGMAMGAANFLAWLF